MALTLNTLKNLDALLNSDRISYKGSELTAMFDIIKELRTEQAEVSKVLRVVPSSQNEAASGE